METPTGAQHGLLQKIAGAVRIVRQPQGHRVQRVDVRQRLAFEELAFCAARFLCHVPKAMTGFA